MAQQVPVCDLW